MSIVRPFKALRPAEEYAEQIASLPYDVMNTEEARVYTAEKPYSFMKIDRAEINFEKGVDPYSPEVYEKAAAFLHQMEKEGKFVQDSKPVYYIYKQMTDKHSQVGIVGCASVDDYLNNVVKKHELTLAKKEEDRCNHVDYCDANTGPIFLTYRPEKMITKVVTKVTKGKPLYNFEADGVQQMAWIIDEELDIIAVESAFKRVKTLYIADGHHRCASAVRIARKRRAQNPDYTGEEEFNYFLSVLFPCDQLEIMDYNRVVADLNGLTKEQFIQKVMSKFSVKVLPSRPLKMKKKHTFGMYIDGEWVQLTANPGTFDEKDIIGQLDVSILQNNLLGPILGIGDPRTDKRIDFIGGIRGLEELEDRCHKDMRVAFAMCPTSLDDLMKIADSGKIMPPKSTWFEPKLLSGLFIHKLK